MIFTDCKTIVHNADNFSHKLGVRHKMFAFDKRKFYFKK